MDLRRRFGGLIRDLRAARDFTQDDLAERSGLSVDSIRRIERGALSPSLETIDKVAQGLEVSLATLFGGIVDGECRPADELCDYLGRMPPAQARLAIRVIRTMFDPAEDGTSALPNRAIVPRRRGR